jgi:hypothetical protein
MVQIGNVPEIIEVKNMLTDLQGNGFVQEWELPYENLLTRRDAAIFFFSPTDVANLDQIWSALSTIPKFQYRENTERKLSNLAWRLEFNKEEMSPNSSEEKENELNP